MEFLYDHTSTRISFRRVGKEDLEDLAALKNESWYGTHRLSLVSESSQARWLEVLDAEDVHTPRNLVLAAVRIFPAPTTATKAGVQTFGVFKILNLDWQSRRAEVGWDVYKPFRNRGLGKKLVKAGEDFCFEVLNLHRLDAQILQTNEASRKCAEAAGFAKEGQQKEAILRQGKWVDNILYGILCPWS
jgi:RimJ/RimL family protein N-acetyltransferase